MNTTLDSFLRYFTDDDDNLNAHHNHALLSLRLTPGIDGGEQQDEEEGGGGGYYVLHNTERLAALREGACAWDAGGCCVSGM
jgi:hypothetical protein